MDSDDDTELELDPDMYPDVIPIFPLTGAVLLPFCVLPLNIFEDRYLAMVRHAAASDGIIGMIQPRPERTDEPAGKGNPPVYSVGGAGRLRKLEDTDDGRILIELLGFSRFKVVEELDVVTPYRQVKVDWDTFKEDQEPDWDDAQNDREGLLDILEKYLSLQDLDADLSAVKDAPDLVLANSLTMALPMDPSEKQALMEAVTAEDRIKTLSALMDMAVRADALGSGDLN